MCLQRFKITLLVAILSLFAMPAYAIPQVKILPSKIVQGKQFLVEILLDDHATPPERIVLDIPNEKKEWRIPLLHIESHKYRAYVAIPADWPAGEYTLKFLDEQKTVTEEEIETKNENGEKKVTKNVEIEIKAKEMASAEINILPGQFSTQSIRYYHPPLSKEQQEIIDKEEVEVKNALNTVSPVQLWQGAFTRPVPQHISSVYGTRRYLNGKYNGYHGGIDFASAMGTPIKATNNAKVVLARYFSKYNSNGNIVCLDHGHGVTSVYLHLSKINVEEGQTVKKGEIIGHVGSTGRSTGPHLHWGVYLNGQNTDALSWIGFTGSFFK